MRTVSKKQFGEFIQSLAINGTPVTGTNIAIMQYVKNGKLVAQSIYRRGQTPVYQLAID